MLRCVTATLPDTRGRSACARMDGAICVQTKDLPSSCLMQHYCTTATHKVWHKDPNAKPKAMTKACCTMHGWRVI